MNDAITDRYAVVGYPIQHSWSPFIHGLFAKQTGQRMSYTRMAVSPENFERDVSAFFASGGKGLNITVPHKQSANIVTRYRTPRAEIARAVNTIVVKNDGFLLGDNTDGAGLVTDLTRNLGFDIPNTRILLLGAGGAARGVIGPLLAAGPEYIEIANRTRARAIELAHEFATLGNVHGCAFEDVSSGVFDLVINATSASLQDEIPQIPRGAIGPATLCYDMAYGKGETSFTRWAKAIGAGRAETGWGMLVEQAAEAFLLWRGVKPETKPVLEAVKHHP